MPRVVICHSQIELENLLKTMNNSEFANAKISVFEPKSSKADLNFLVIYWAMPY